jgi:DNA recombination protein RmuC
MDATTILWILVALAFGALIGWLVAHARLGASLRTAASDATRARSERDGARVERERAEAALGVARAKLETEQQSRAAAEARVAEAERRIVELRQFIAETKGQMESTYAKLSRDALSMAMQQLNELVKPQLEGTKEGIEKTLAGRSESIENLLKPIREMLDKYRGELAQSEQQRAEAFGGIQEQIRNMLSAHERAQHETSKLVNALKVPTVSGSWGENTLRNTVELSGMSEFCDFLVQHSVETEEGRRLRPDMIIRLPSERVIAVDSKAPIDAYLEAAGEADEEKQKQLLAQHARNLRRHVDLLSKKEYQASVGETLDFTVLFLGGEHFLSSALLVDPSIFEYAVQRKIYLATPTILLPLLRAVSAGWKAERAEENAQRALEIGKELYLRFVRIFEYLEPVGDSLSKAMEKYNAAVRSINTRLIPHVEKLQEYAGGLKDPPQLKQIEKAVESINKDDARLDIPQSKLFDRN